MKSIAVFASGNGSNFEALVNSKKFKVSLLVCNNPNAYVIERAKRHNIDTYIFNHNDYNSINDYEIKIINELKKRKIDLIVLAGFMRLLSNKFLSHYQRKVLNIHPSLLPDYPGVNAIKRAYEDNSKRFGVSVFYVDDGIDTGELIVQEGFDITNESFEEVEARIHEIEHRIYPKVISDILRGEENEVRTN